MKRSNTLKEIGIILVFLVVLSIILYIGINITGFVTLDQEEVIKEKVEKIYTEDSVISVDLSDKNYNKIKGIKISGYSEGDESFEIYINDSGKKLLILGGEKKLEQDIREVSDIGRLTGKVVGEVIEDIPTSEEVSEAEIDSTIEQSEDEELPPEPEEEIQDEPIEDEAINDTNEEIEDTSDLDFNETDVDEDNASTIDDDINDTIEINESNINETDNLTDKEIDLNEVNESKSSKKIFNEKCVSTCSLDLDSKTFDIIIKLANTTLYIDEIVFVIEVDKIDDTPRFVEIDDLYIQRNNNLSLNLIDYLINFANNNLEFNYTISDNINLTIYNNSLTITPSYNYTGIESMIIEAFDGLNTGRSNNVTIYIVDSLENKTEENKTPSNITEELIQYPVVINEPVKWEKRIRSDKSIDSYNISIPEYSFGLEVYEIVNGREVLVKSEKKDQKEKKEFEINLITGNIIFDFFGDIFKLTGFATYDVDKNKVILKNISKEFLVRYYTPGPESNEINISDWKKRIVVSGMEYDNVLVYTSLDNVPKNSISLFSISNRSVKPLNFTTKDLDNDSLEDYIEWTVPKLVNQTYQTFEIQIIILNVQSYPTLYGNWTVLFNTTGEANLSIFPITGTTWDINTTNNSIDLEFQDIMCGNNSLNYSMYNNSIFIQNYSCYYTGYEISKVLTEGKHHLQFNFGNQVAYANNTATAPPNITWISPTPDDGDTVTELSVYLNTSIVDTTNTSAFFDWNYTLIGYWSVDENNASGLFDNSTYDHFGEFSGDIGQNNISDAVYGDGTTFDNNDNYINMGNSSEFNITDDFTISAWFNITGDLIYGEIEDSPLEMLEYESVDQDNPYLIEISENIIGVVYKGDAQDGILKTFEVLNNGSMIELDSEIFNTNGQNPAIIKVNDEIYSISYRSAGADGFVVGANISSNGTINDPSIGAHTEFNTDSGGGSYQIKVNGSVVAIAHKGSSTSPFNVSIATVHVYPNGTTSTIDLETVDTSDQSSLSPYLAHINDTVYAVAYNGNSTNGMVTTFNIQDNGTVNDSFIDNYVVSSNGDFVVLEPITESIYALFYQGASADGFVSTFNIYSNGTISDSNIDTFEYDTIFSDNNRVSHVFGNIYAISYGANGFAPTVSTVEIYNDGTIRNSIVDSIVLGDTSLEKDIIRVSKDIFITVYEANLKGNITTVKINSDGGITKEGDYGLTANTSDAIAYVNGQTITGTLSSGWNHVAMTYDKDLSVDNFVLFVNGDQVDTTNLTEQVRTNTKNFTVGYNFNGSIDEILIWKRVLSNQEINSTMNNSLHKLFNNFTGLVDEQTYYYSAYAIDTFGNLNMSSRTVIVNTLAPTNNAPVTSTPILNSTSANNLSIDDLLCNFVITDDDSGDNLFANFTWFLNETVNISGQASVTNNTNTNVSLGSGNTTEGEYWRCEINPYDETDYGTAINSSNLTIKNTLPTITFVSPTPDNNSVVDVSSVYLNTTITDDYQTSAFFDWNNSLIAYWSMDSANASGMFDNSSYDQFASFGGGGGGGEGIVKKAPGIYGNATTFDAVDDTLNVTYNDKLGIGTSDFSVELWFKRNTTTQIHGFIDHRSESGDRIGWDLIVISDDSFKSPNEIRLFVDSGTPSAALDSNTTIGDTNWHHVAYTINKSSETGGKIYVDGVQEDAVYNVTKIGNITNPEDLVVGVRIDTAQTNFMNGSIDEIRIYRRVLSETEVNASYNNGLYRLENNFTGLSGNYNYSAYAIDTFGMLNKTGLYNVTVNVPPSKVTLESPTNGNDSLEDRSPTFNWTAATDGDGDSLTYHIEIDDSSDFDSPIVNVTSISNNFYTILVDLTVDLLYNWRVRANDGTQFGDYSDTWNFTVASTLGITLNNNSVAFGSKAVNDTDDTTDDDPSPFVLENSGNVMLDINLTSAGGLFTSVSLGDTAYRFKVDNGTETGSFNSSGSIIDWTNIPTGSILAVDQLNYTDTHDTVQCDINITIPTDEGAGSKSDDITFTAINAE